MQVKHARLVRSTSKRRKLDGAWHRRAHLRAYHNYLAIRCRVKSPIQSYPTRAAASEALASLMIIINNEIIAATINSVGVLLTFT